MSVEFPGEKYTKNIGANTSKTSAMVKWIMKTGLVKDKTQANIALLVIAVIFLGISTSLFIDSNSAVRLNPMDKNSIPEEVRLQFSEKVFTQLPEKFYLEDIPSNILNKLSPEIIESIPSKNR